MALRAEGWLGFEDPFAAWQFAAAQDSEGDAEATASPDSIRCASSRLTPPTIPLVANPEKWPKRNLSIS
jgi:hypothetical protein